ncbi:MAG: bifunctional phosphoribosylaminoimidazolecarboxamide formyltransferase/IMP cyclohydrolase [Planctomycetes bacterium]|nr:bifunctional phosphoribosylaminoimidazolecarboxamide formyltransferase/IMP cyclohydrolase [Planctomycetota bacterium]
MTQRRLALISVTDKRGVVEFARGLTEIGFTVLSTGGTYREIREGGVDAVEVSDYTGFPEIMDGRVKTLHPRIHGGILARRSSVEDAGAMKEHGIEPIDIVAVNLYRFRETVQKPGASRAEIVENIDIGGPSMIRAAAKNHASVAVVVDTADYAEVLGELRALGNVSEDTRRRLAGKAYAHTAAYDVAVAGWFEGERAKEADRPSFGASFALAGSKLLDLRYGENPHQAAALYDDPNHQGPSLARAKQLSGKELSYNNLADLDAALGLVLEFDDPACVIVKHNNPCGTAIAPTAKAAFVHALDADSLSAFGGIVALNRPLDADCARAMVEHGVFVEAIVAPEVPADALRILGEAKWGQNVRVLALGGTPRGGAELALRPVSGGLLVQTADVRAPLPELTVATKRAPGDAERRALEFAWNVCKHVKSNAIVLARPSDDGGVCATVGVGAGQMSRVDAAKIAVEKAGDKAAGAVLASDAFFPFADGIEAATRAGVTAVIQPGGSKRDSEVVAAADAANVAMVFTGRRHFRH